jgi:hypothetical protein
LDGHRDWTPVDFTEIKNNKASFENVGRNIAYMVADYDDSRMIPASHPFILKSNGEVQYLIPDTNYMREIKLFRKFPKSWNVAKMEERVVSGKIQAATNPLFTDSVTFYCIADRDYPDLIPLHSEKPYRYWRYLSKDGTWGSVAEIQFFEKDSIFPRKGIILGTEPQKGKKKEFAFDDDWLTSYDGEYNGTWLGMDFRTPVIIDKVRIVPRTDDNLIHYGDEYELVYCLNGEWTSLGKQTAKERYLHFSNAPANALFLLRNLTQGSEERIFTYENGKQIWW